MSLKYVLPESGKEVNNLIKTAKRMDMKAREAIQIALVGIAYHAWKHKDWTGIQVLLEAEDSVKTGRRGAIEWACRFIGLELVPKVKDGKELKQKTFGKWKGSDHIEANFSKAKETMYWELDTTKDQLSGFDINDAIRMAMKKRAKYIADMKAGKYSADDAARINLRINSDLVKALEQAMAQDLDAMLAPEEGQLGVRVA